MFTKFYSGTTSELNPMPSVFGTAEARNKISL